MEVRSIVAFVSALVAEAGQTRTRKKRFGQYAFLDPSNQTFSYMPMHRSNSNPWTNQLGRRFRGTKKVKIMRRTSPT